MLNILRAGCILFFAAIAASGHSARAECPPEPVKPTPEVIQSALRNASDHGYLWRISKDGRTSYLYGTIHVGKPDWIFPGPTVSAALRATDSMALELDIMDPEVRTRMQKGIESLHGHALPEPLEKRMKQQAEALCVPYETLAKFPAEIQIADLTIMDSRWEGLDASYAVDAFLAAVGHKANKNVVSLETPESQLQSLQMDSAQETADAVQDSLDEMQSKRSRKMLRRLADAWEHSDYAMMEHFEDWCECLKTDVERAMMKRMLDDRNPPMAEHIDALHQSGKQVFVAVGSLHMFGPSGLPVLMTKRGYKVERVDLKGARASEQAKETMKQPK